MKGNVLHKGAHIGSGSKLYGTSLGMHSGCNENCVIINSLIGNYCNISWNVNIGPRGHIYANFTSHDLVYSSDEVLSVANNGCFDGYINKLGHDVWIGCNATILPGVEIGNGAIVAAGSVVVKSVPPYAIVGGNPAKFIKWRFSREKIEMLEDTRWYNLDAASLIEKKVELEKLVDFDIEHFRLTYNKRRKNMICGVRV